MNPVARSVFAGCPSPYGRRMSVPVIVPNLNPSPPKHFFELLDNSNDTIKMLADKAKFGLQNEVAPELCEDGVGGVYFMKDGSGTRLAVFKPQDEEPFNANNPKGFRPRRNSFSSFKEGILIGEACVREASAFLLDHAGFSGVPPTDLAFCEHPVFFLTTENIDGNEVGVNAKNQGKRKLGSFQKYLTHDGNTEDMPPAFIAQFPVEEVHKIALLDIRLFNTDRHGGNILYKEKREPNGTNHFKLMPIDHGYTLPSTLDEAWFVWQHWPQVKQKMSEKTLQYIKELDVEKDIKILLEKFPRAFRKEHFRVLRISTILLKSAAESGLTLFQISNIMTRVDLKKPSILEELCVKAAQLSQNCEDQFCSHLRTLVNAEIQKIRNSSVDCE